MEATYPNHTSTLHMSYYCSWGKDLWETTPETSDSELELRVPTYVLNSFGYRSLDSPFSEPKLALRSEEMTITCQLQYLYLLSDFVHVGGQTCFVLQLGDTHGLPKQMPWRLQDEARVFVVSHL